ncbi:DUF1622 domain-containing protein [Ferruginibacter sp. SUN106]|uniref:DUF1622 domain-containing protein n=1 Tax=Ferruginibacter sp. SUN106 TaxID=2978348 RepID=UPI003D35C369
MEEIAKTITEYISHTLEIISALVIATALLQLIIDYFKSAIKKKKIITAEEARVKFGSSVAVALELLLGGDVLTTAVAPSWNDIGKLAAIATIRTILNYFLERELSHMHQTKSHMS